MAILGFLIVLFNLVAGPLLAPATGARLTRGLDGPLGDRIEICTGSGILVVDRDGKPIKQEKPQEVCAFCLPLLSGGVDLPLPDFLPAGTPAVPVDLEFALVDGQFRPARGNARANAPRAPPAS